MVNPYWHDVFFRTGYIDVLKKRYSDSKFVLNITDIQRFRKLHIDELKKIYDDIIVYDKEEADKYAAKAGFSEHQLGTTLDIANVWTIEEGDKEYNWIEKNGYKYGFIFRYKKKYEDITGYAEEGWHIRYVGVEAATEIHKKGISFDEYWIKYINKKSSK